MFTGRRGQSRSATNLTRQFPLSSLNFPSHRPPHRARPARRRNSNTPFHRKPLTKGRQMANYQHARPILKHIRNILECSAGALIVGALNWYVLPTSPAIAGSTYYCCQSAYETPVGANNGSCVFQGFCNGRATATSCVDSKAVGTTGCSTVTGQTGWVSASCNVTANTSATCTLATTSSPIHTWKGICNGISTSYNADTDVWTCTCSCGQTITATATGNVQYSQCATGSTGC
jgi:hypothetical protein